MLNRNARLCIIALFLPFSLITPADSTTVLGNKSSKLENTTINELVDWQTYQDDKDGYKIQYPQEWKIVESTFPSLDQKSFAITADNDPSTSLKETLVNVYVTKESSTFDPTTLKMQTLPLEQYANQKIAELTSSKGEPTILKNEAITLDGQPAWRLDYIRNYLGAQTNYGSHIFVTNGEKLYDISLWLNPFKVEEIRPVGEKIIQTFQFFNNTGLEDPLGQSGKNKPLESKNAQSNSNCEESYPDVCITTDMGCSHLEVRNFKVTGSDPNNLDPDGDGIGCEN